MKRVIDFVMPIKVFAAMMFLTGLCIFLRTMLRIKNFYDCTTGLKTMGNGKFQ